MGIRRQQGEGVTSPSPPPHFRIWKKKKRKTNTKLQKTCK